MNSVKVSVDIPEAELAELDARAEALERPRAWVIRRAVRAYLEREPPADERAATGTEG